MCMDRNEATEVNPVRCQVRIAATRYASVSKLGSSSLNALLRICRRKFVIGGRPGPTRMSNGQGVRTTLTRGVRNSQKRDSAARDLEARVAYCERAISQFILFRRVFAYSASVLSSM